MLQDRTVHRDEKMTKSQKNCNGKSYDFEIFVLKYVSQHSESIPTKTSERRGALQSGQIVSELGSNPMSSLMASELGNNPMVS